MFDEFCATFGIKFDLPVSPELARAFVTWALSKKKFKSSTVRSYVSSVNIAHILGNIKNVNLSSDPCIKLLLKGASKSCDLELNNKTNRLPMNLPLLKILSHRIALLDWSDLSKQAFWTACTVSFFTSCIMGELLTSSVKNFDLDTSLLWKHVKLLGEKKIVMMVPYSKTTGFKGKAVDVFALHNDKKCPALALLKLRELTTKRGIFNWDRPVFSFGNGRNLTKAMLNSWLSNLLSDLQIMSLR